MAFITLDTNQMMVPVLIPRMASPAVTGWNSLLVASGLTVLGWLLFGSRVRPAKKKTPKGRSVFAKKRK